MTIVRVPGRKKLNGLLKFQAKRVSNFKKRVFMTKMIQKIGIPKTVPNIKIPCHNKNIANIDFSILEIL